MPAPGKSVLLDFIQHELALPPPGIAPVHAFTQRECTGMQALIDYIRSATPAPSKLGLRQPREILAGLKSIVIVAIPNYLPGPLPLEVCRADLRGTLSPLHVSPAYQQHLQHITTAVGSFFTERGCICRPVPPTFPLKIMAARCGIGYYGKSSMLIRPGYGSWISLQGFLTDAVFEPDAPLADTCGVCDLCVEACPAGALHNPYSCDMELCLNFQLQNKAAVPVELRSRLRNFLAYGACRVCRDVCPHNRHLVPAFTPDVTAEALSPALPDILTITDEGWRTTYAATRMGRIMQDKRYLVRNALIALGNFQDRHAVPHINRFLGHDDLLLREHAAWALARIDAADA